ncbi:ferrous iron transport protein A [Methanohalophilus levihalophilus]|uniref:FeoA family protein n=1 Tax=Methanohalophilus levihalophilus TaxID=1431282 RepID=UPI001AEA75B8|nr:FeoA family protein [Methanohalophilus levihalophilus]MBP2030703.1 ferrous iron transport protein A [Methanohalophilus levihalophilus]
MGSKMPLCMAPKGQDCKVCEICAGKALGHRLTEIGFNQHSCLKVVGSERGSVVVHINGSKYALGRGMAMKIIVEPVAGGEAT